MATDRQTAANRENAKKSTGPRTPEGKARSCLNHLTSGIHAQSVIIPGENRDEYVALSGRYFTQYQPANDAERHQVDILVACDWLSLRLIRAESQTWCRGMMGPIRRNEPHPLGEGFAFCPKTFRYLDWRVEKNERIYNHALHELEKLQSARFAAEALEVCEQHSQTVKH